MRELTPNLLESADISVSLRVLCGEEAFRGHGPLLPIPRTNQGLIKGVRVIDPARLPYISLIFCSCHGV